MNDIVINYLIKKNFIVEDEKEEYLYGIEVLELKILHTVGIIAISIINHRFIEMILFLTFYSYIRSIIGGYFLVISMWNSTKRNSRMVRTFRYRNDC